jgi:hypothetical protein
MVAISDTTKTSERAHKEQALIAALEAAWFFPAEEKRYWIENVSILPDHTLDNVLDQVRHTSEIIGNCINAALEKNPDNPYLKEIKLKVQKGKKNAFEIEEAPNKNKAEEELTKNLKEI